NSLTVSIQTGFKYLFNVGSIGQPRNRDPRTSFAIYDSEEKTVTRFRIPYGIASAQRKILAAGLPERLALRLETGN
ncbi:MAG: metallophosphatase family protein, partial [Victivallales bacterium]|nr:metallophosphatase family protein [Victivallales bacterium]